MTLTQVAVGVRVVRVEPQGFLQGRLGCCCVSHGEQRTPQQLEAAEVAGVQDGGLPAREPVDSVRNCLAALFLRFIEAEGRASGWQLQAHWNIVQKRHLRTLPVQGWCTKRHNTSLIASGLALPHCLRPTGNLQQLAAMPGQQKTTLTGKCRTCRRLKHILFCASFA